jgi:hypothetical protein
MSEEDEEVVLQNEINSYKEQVSFSIKLDIYFYDSWMNFNFKFN